MTANPDLEREVRSWLREDGHEDADRVLFAALSQIDTTPQRHAGWLARRTQAMAFPIRVAAAITVVAAAVLAGYLLLPDANTGTTPTPSPTASPRALPMGPARPLDAGLYTLAEGFPVTITFQVPEGWTVCSERRVEQNLCRTPTGSETWMTGVNFLVIDNVRADPCGPDVMLDPPPGPTVDDLVGAISNMPGFDVSDPVDLTLGGFSGKQIEVRPRADIGCDDIGTWSAGGRTNGVGLDEVNVLRILDVAGTRIVIASAFVPDDVSEEALAEVERVIESIRIEP